MTSAALQTIKSILEMLFIVCCGSYFVDSLQPHVQVPLALLCSWLQVLQTAGFGVFVSIYFLYRRISSSLTKPAIRGSDYKRYLESSFFASSCFWRRVISFRSKVICCRSFSLSALFGTVFVGAISQQALAGFHGTVPSVVYTCLA